MIHKYLSILALAVLAIFAATSCSKEESANPELDELQAKGGVLVSETPDWLTLPDDNLFPKSMFVFIDQTGLPTTITESDMLSAWVAGTCRAVVAPHFGSEGYNRFQLKISLPTSMITQSGNYVELCYYSAKHHLVFTSKPILFTEDTHLGEYQQGYHPEWKK